MAARLRAARPTAARRIDPLRGAHIMDFLRIIVLMGCSMRARITMGKRGLRMNHGISSRRAAVLPSRGKTRTAAVIRGQPLQPARSLTEGSLSAAQALFSRAANPAAR
ncbi:hypothetical protein ACRAVF_23480 [Bradyrhizobium oligotrophicum S58]